MWLLVSALFLSGEFRILISQITDGRDFSQWKNEYKAFLYPSGRVK